MLSPPSPRVAAYLEKLPAGAGSYPGCLAKAAMLRRSLDEQPLSRAELELLPPAVRPVVTCPPLDGEWVSDVHLACVLMAIADARGWTDEAYLGWIRALNVRMFGSIFRFAMTAPTPGAIARAVPERWGIFHRGTRLELAELRPGRGEARLAFPPWLFHGLALRQFTPVLEAALRLADPGARVELVEAGVDGARWLASWAA